jgi:hypothetical protein
VVVVVLLVLSLVSSGICGDRDFTPGTPLNPYVASPRIGGGYEIRPSIPDMDNQNLSKPGTWSNPIIVRPDRYGGYKMSTSLPDFGADDDSGDE